MRWIACACCLAGIVLLAAATPPASLVETPVVVKKVKIVAIYGKRTLEAGEVSNYIIRTNSGATYPIDYYWDAGDGVFIEGRSVDLQFEKEGLYTITVTARNRYGTDSETLVIKVIAPSVRERSKEVAETPAAPVERTPRGSPRGSTRPSRAATPDRAALFGSENIALNQGGYTWVIETHLHRETAELDVINYRVAGFRAGVFVDDEGSGSTAYRIIIGHFPTEQAALQARSRLPKNIPGGTLLLKLPDAAGGTIP